MNEDFDRNGSKGGGFITCHACGTRISADREYCLRCGQRLVPAPKTLEWSTLTAGRPLMMLVATVVVLAAVGALVWINRPTIGEESVQARTPVRSSPAPSPASSLPAAVEPPRSAEPTGASRVSITPLDDEEFLDAARVAESGVSIDDQSLKARLERAIAQNPNDADAVNDLGQAMARLGDPAGAAAKFERAIELVPDRWLYHYNLARARGELMEWDRAALEYSQAMRLSHDDYRLQFNLALALHKMGNDQTAITEFQAAIRMAPAEANFHVALATSLEKVGQFSAAQQELQRYLAIEPAGAKATIVKGHLEGLTAAQAAPAS